MVNRLVFRLILIPILWALVANAVASDTLSAEADRQRLYEGEVLSLTVKGTMTIDINLSNLFDFDASSLPQPDMQKVKDTFDIIGQNQRYSIETVNGEMIGQVTWVYQLAPKKTGNLTIPSLRFRDAQSDAITVEVVDDNPPGQNSSPRDSFIELSADKREVYVQEQLILSVKLFFNGNLIGGELSEPSHPNAIIESLGKQTESSRYRDGMRYRVVERLYTIFPQQPGELTLPEIRFEGQARDSSGRLKFLRDSKQLFTIPVAGVPDNFTGDTWLPAAGMALSESGLPSDPTIEAGQNLSRKLTLVARGLPAEALPPFNYDMPAGIRAYPDSPARETLPDEEGLAARLEQTAALVPVDGGELTLPEIRIPWWDTTTNTEKVAVIAARTLQVQAAPGQPQTNANQTANPVQSPQPDSDSNSGPGPAAALPAQQSSWLWPAVVLILLAGWALTGFGWWYSRRSRDKPGEPKNREDESEKALFATLCESAKAGAPETPDHLVRWAQHQYPQSAIVGLGDAYRVLGSEVVERKIRQLQARAYSQQSGIAESWQGDDLVQALTGCRKQMVAKPAARGQLPGLYPDELNTG